MYVLIAPFSQSFDDLGLTYKVPSDFPYQLQKGMIVSIPFGNTTELGIILDFSDSTQIPEMKIKEIQSFYETNPLLYPYQIELISYISRYYFCLIHASNQLFFPKNLLGKLQKNTFDITKKLPEKKYTFDYKKNLNTYQKDIFQQILSPDDQYFLLHGITGSGKTEVYIQLIEYYISQSKQVLLLVPEIILTNQIFERIQRVFGQEVIILNSTVSEAKKTLYRQEIYSGNAKVIIGTRSALFYPYKDLGMIMIDEEHDNSYISDNTPRYDAIEIALKIAELTGIKLLLGSATPKMNHYYLFLQKKYKIMNLFQEYT